MDTKKYSKVQEEYVAKALHGDVVAGSGAPIFKRGDVLINGKMIIECKTTTKDNLKSWSIKKEWLDQNEKERLDLMLPYSAIALSLDSSGKNNIYILNENTMKALVGGL